METDGNIRPAGDVTYVVNPPTISPENAGIQFSGGIIDIHVSTDGSVSVRLTGVATYHDRTAQYGFNIEPNQALVDELNKLMEEYGTEIHNQAVSAAADALGVARRKQEL